MKKIRQKAFTLVEVLIAMSLLATALLLLMNSWTMATGRIKKTQTAFEMASLLERKMNDFERKYKGKPLSEIQDSEEDDFGDEYPQYSWKMAAKKLEMPDIAASLSAREGGVDAMTQTVIKQLTDQLSKSIKEVTITVILKTGKKNIEISATTYFVDYDQPLNLGGVGH